MTLRTGKRGFTLIEILVCVAILSTGIVFIFRSFFTCMNTFSRYAAYLNILPRINEELWRAQDEIVRAEGLHSFANQGEFVYEGKKFFWQLASSLENEKEKLYRLDLAVSWQEAKKRLTLERYAYVTLE